MQLDSFFNEIDRHNKDQLPFTIYRLPNELELTAWLQQSKALRTITDFSEEGFVFAPFENSADTVLFEKSNSRILHSRGVINQRFEGTPELDLNETQKNEYQGLIEKAVNEINSSVLSKVVLSRVIEMNIDQNDPLILFKRLLSSYPNAFVYCWFHPSVGLWLGATPELLLKTTRNKLTTVSLAGTISEDSNANWTDKEKYEQQLVTDYIISQLGSVANTVEPGVVKHMKAGRLTHLKTEIKAIVDFNSFGLSDVISKLHPTPAVCGYPTELAKNFIKKYESYDRQYYTGFLGEINCTKEKSRSRSDKNVENTVFKSVVKESQLFVNLRCLQLVDNKANIFVGGGVVGSSNPEKEWQETVDKSKTMLSIL